MTSSTDTSRDTDEIVARLRETRPAEGVVDLDAALHLAQLMRKYAGAKDASIVFRKWQVERCLGRGGMGAVYLARDMTLGREVALKVIRGAEGRASQAEQTRMIREAQALASCNHKNIVGVLSVDESDPDMVVLEMEYVDGVTLRDWNSDRRRSWRELTGVYAHAAVGLAAIHEQGIVHRDIKPDNLLMSTAGIVKVADFGLAVSESLPLHRRGLGLRSKRDEVSSLALRVTSQGALVGTHGYIAPEVLAGADATAQSDQFSLAAALFEALFGALPFEGDTPQALAAALREGPASPRAGRSVPQWLTRALRRALAFEPSRRFQTTDKFCLALRRGLALRRLGWASLAGIFVLVVTFSLAWSSKPPPPDPCAEIGEPLRVAWAGVRERLRAGEPRPSGELLLSVFDDRVGGWLDTRQEFCASELRRSPVDVAARESAMRQGVCLQHALHGYRALIDEVSAALDGDRDTPMAELISAVETLPICEDPRIFSRWPWAYSERADDALAEALSLELGGQLMRAEARAREIAGSQGSPPQSRAAALYRLGHILGSLHRLDAALAAIDDAYRLAVRNGYDALACQAAIHRAKLEANIDFNVVTSARDIANAEAWRARVGLKSPILRADLLEARGLLEEARGAPQRAADLHREALSVRRRMLGDRHVDVAKSIHNLANSVAECDDERGRSEAALLFKEAVELRQQSLGPQHPLTADVIFDQARFESDSSSIEAARASFLRALKIYEAARGGHEVVRAKIHVALAVLDRREGEFLAAEAQLEEAAGILDSVQDLRTVRYDRALLLLEQGSVALLNKKFGRARQRLERALDLFRRRSEGSDNELAVLVLWIEAVFAQGDVASIEREVSAMGPRLVGYVGELSAPDRGKVAWYIAESLKQGGQSVDAAVFFWIALRAYEELAEADFVTELRVELAQALLVGSNAELARWSAALGCFRDNGGCQWAAVLSR